jgi:hypothetical protein
MCFFLVGELKPRNLSGERPYLIETYASMALSSSFLLCPLVTFHEMAFPVRNGFDEPACLQELEIIMHHQEASLSH